MAENYEQAFKNGVLTFLGGLVESSSEVAQPMAPAEYAAVSQTQSKAGFSNDGSQALKPVNQLNPLLLWGGIGVGVLVIVILLVVALKGGK